MRRAMLVLATVVLAVGVAAGCDEGSDGGNEGAREVAAQEDQDAVEAPAVDTGRMSEGEYDRARKVVLDFNQEIADYADRISSRCGVILQGGEISNTLDCVEEAYDGVEGQAGLTAVTLDELRADTGKRCRRAVTIAANLTNRPLYNALQLNKAALDSLDADAIAATTAQLTKQQARWNKASLNMMVLCEPA